MSCSGGTCGQTCEDDSQCTATCNLGNCT
jgi:hypothetical protein